MAKTILITGASTGLGAESATYLAKGNIIFVHYHSSEKDAEQVAVDVETSGGKAFLVQADLSSEQGCRDLVTAVAGQTAKLDVLVNNAGGLIRRNTVRKAVVPEREWL